MDLEQNSPALLGLKPDIAILSEVKEQHVEQFKSRGSVLFAGEAPKKGLAVVGWNGWKLERAGEVSERWFLPLIATRGAHRIHMLAMWVLPTKNYVAPTLNELDRYKDFLTAEKSIVVGDFNQNVKFDKGRKGKSHICFRAGVV